MDEQTPADRSDTPEISIENMAAFLEAAMADADSDPTCVPRALAAIARARNVTNFSRLAQETGMSRAGIHKALNPDGNPSFVNIAALARAVGLRVILEPMERNSKHE